MKMQFHIIKSYFKAHLIEYIFLEELPYQKDFLYQSYFQAHLLNMCSFDIDDSETVKF